ncbi:Hypothetical predicted protein [Marmota monax]|uniref:Membrane-spanning 4-domains subfamily A member 13 n=1 Tax=Marmota monax TaxID=9995 RepID=A0A5E4AL06_MARMO|nr:hypothetical protein GHT09_001602 [Marmota monax]VTJ57379.1 Hypothetical predicted protein [Marmota monax]
MDEGLTFHQRPGHFAADTFISDTRKQYLGAAIAGDSQQRLAGAPITWLRAPSGSAHAYSLRPARTQVFAQAHEDSASAVGYPSHQRSLRTGSGLDSGLPLDGHAAASGNLALRPPSAGICLFSGPGRWSEAPDQVKCEAIQIMIGIFHIFMWYFLLVLYMGQIKGVFGTYEPITYKTGCAFWGIFYIVSGASTIRSTQKSSQYLTIWALIMNIFSVITAFIALCLTVLELSTFHTVSYRNYGQAYVEAHQWK